MNDQKTDQEAFLVSEQTTIGQNRINPQEKHVSTYKITTQSMNSGKIYDTPLNAYATVRELCSEFWGFPILLKSDYGWIVKTRDETYFRDITDLDNNGNLKLSARSNSCESSEISVNKRDIVKIFKVIRRCY